MVKKDRVLRKPEVLKLSGMSHPTIWRWENAGLFPKRIALGPNSCGWLESEVYKWLNDKANERTPVVVSSSISIRWVVPVSRVFRIAARNFSASLGGKRSFTFFPIWF